MDKRYPYMIFVLLGLLGIFYKYKQVLYTMHEYKCFYENIPAGVVGTSLLPETKGIPLNQGKANTITYMQYKHCYDINTNYLKKLVILSPNLFIF